MIGAVVLCPSPPMLLPEYVGLQDPAAALRARGVEALASALRAPQAACDLVVIVTGREVAPRTKRAPLGVRVGRLLLALAGWDGPVEEVVVPSDATAPVVERAGRRLGDRTERILLLVVGDGSARRSEKAPGYLDERSFGFDDAVLAALEDLDPRALLAVDAALAAELLASWRSPLQVMAQALPPGASTSGGVLWSGDPYGVLYAVGRWTATVPG